MSKEKTLRTLEETEVMQATGVPAQETEEVSTALATEIIADSRNSWRKQRKKRKSGKKVGICVVSRFEHCPGSQILLVWC